MQDKPIGRKNYGQIPHLPGSRLGPSDKQAQPGQARIATEKARDRHDEVIGQEKLDGSNVGVARVSDSLIPLGRAGYNAFSSPHKQHVLFGKWVYSHYARFMDTLQDGERLVGEWMVQAHGTRYDLPHEPFVAFDLMVEDKRMPYDEFMARLDGRFVTPHVIHRGGPISIEDCLAALPEHGHHGALEQVEGAVWRVERDRRVSPNSSERRRVVDFLCKYVRPDKVDGKYLLDGGIIWNTQGGVSCLKKLSCVL